MRFQEVLFTRACIKALNVGNLDIKPLTPNWTATFAMHPETAAVDVVKST
jgi:hypothetical protein